MSISANTEQSRIGSQVDLGAIVLALDDESGESGTDLNSLDAEACTPERRLHGREQPIDRFNGQAEEVEIPSLAVHISAGDQGGAAGEREVCRLSMRYTALRWPSIQPAQARRTGLGSTSSSQSSSNSIGST